MRQRALARERFLGVKARKSPHERPAGALREPEAAALAFGKRGDPEVAVGRRELRQVSLEIGVDEQEAARRRRALGEGQRLSFAASRQAENPSAGLLRCRGRFVAGTVVGNDHLRITERGAQRLDRARDRGLLVARGNEDRCDLTHARPCRARAARRLWRLA